jgi:hypothetical protein
MNTWSKWCTKVKASFLIKTSSMRAWILCSTSHTPIWHELGEWTDTPSSPQQISRHIHRQEALERRGVHSAVVVPTGVLPTGSPSSPLATSETLPQGQRLHRSWPGAVLTVTHLTRLQLHNRIVKLAHIKSSLYVQKGSIASDLLWVFSHIQIYSVQFLKSSKKVHFFSSRRITFCRICFWYLKSSVFSQPQLGHHMLMNWIMMSYCFAS